LSIFKNCSIVVFADMLCIGVQADGSLFCVKAVDKKPRANMQSR
jgi:hypothetical protein